MRVLVTGVTGQVGGALFTALGEPATVVLVSRAALDLAPSDTIAPVLDRIARHLITGAEEISNPNRRTRSG